MRSAAPKHYQVFARLHALDPWTYVDTYAGAALVMQAQNLIKARGCQAKVTPTCAVTAPANVLAHG